MKDTTDVNILALAREPKGMEEAFRLLVSAHKERLYHHIRRMVVEHADTDDVLQNTFIKAYRALPRFKGNSALYTWLYRIASNEALTFLKKKKAKQTISDEVLMHDTSLKAETPLDGQDVMKKLQAAIAQLPDKQRIVFNMRYFDEMPYSQISEVLDTSVGALKASFHHAAKKIEKALNELDYYA